MDVKGNPRSPSDVSNKQGNGLDWLSKFTLSLSSHEPGAYANGNQQIELSILVATLDGTPISGAEYQSIRLFRKSNGVYREIPFNANVPRDWAQQTEKNDDFDYYDPYIYSRSKDGASQKLRSPAGNAESTKTLYLTTQAASNSTLTLCAGIQDKEGNWIYSGEDPWQSEERLIAHAPPTFVKPGDYQLTFSREDNDSIPSRFIKLYSLKPSRVSFVQTECTPVGMIKWSTQEPGNSFATHVGTVRTGERTVDYEKEIEQTFSDEFKSKRQYTQLREVNTDRLVVVVQGDNQIYFDSAIATRYRTPMELKGIDQQGNRHTLRIVFTHGSREELAIE